MDALARVRALKLPFAELMGIEFTAAAPERVVGEMTVREALCTRPAVLHGGAIMAFADTLGAAATILNLPDFGTAGDPGTTTPGTTTPGTTTIESKTNFIAAAPLGARVTGEATPLHRGRRTMVWQTRVTTADGRLVALVTQTQLVL
jgi:1,4-dihydroxy-2-naphthoyl-CoA hydrolase